MRGIVTLRQQVAKSIVAQPRVLYRRLGGAIRRQVDDARALAREDSLAILSAVVPIEFSQRPPTD